MTNTTDGEPFRKLAEMSARDLEVARLLELVCEISATRGDAGVDALLSEWEAKLGIQAEPVKSASEIRP